MKHRKFGVSIGTGYAYSPVLQQPVVVGGFQVAPIPMIEVGLNFAYLLDLAANSWTTATVQQVESNEPVAVTVQQFRSEIVVGFAPIEVGGKRVSLRPGVYLGGGVVQTQDDVNLTQNRDSVEAEASHSQIHPTLVFGLAASLLSRRGLGGRFRLEGRRWGETFYLDDVGPYIFPQTPFSYGIDFLVRF